LKETERTKEVATEAGRKGDDSLEGEEAEDEIKGELIACERFKTCVDIRRYTAVRPWNEGALRATLVGALGKSTCRLNELMLLCVVCERRKATRRAVELLEHSASDSGGEIKKGAKPSSPDIRRISPPSPSKEIQVLDTAIQLRQPSHLAVASPHHSQP